jgi:hypothetical protein
MSQRMAGGFFNDMGCVKEDMCTYWWESDNFCHLNDSRSLCQLLEARVYYCEWIMPAFGGKSLLL